MFRFYPPENTTKTFLSFQISYTKRHIQDEWSYQLNALLQLFPLPTKCCKTNILSLTNITKRQQAPLLWELHTC